VAGDVPFLPRDLVGRLSRNLIGHKADIVLARCAQGLHPTIGLWPVDLAERLERDLLQTEIRSLRDWSGQFRLAQAAFASAALTNINTPGELAACQGIINSPWAEAI
jgi:molybdopterin-guanine dinucleotide biosynthesis protein A